MTTTTMHTQRGLTLGSFIGGLLIGLLVALAVALYVTKAPIPFLDKGPQRTDEQNQAEAAKNKDWNPNASLQSSVPLPQAQQPAQQPQSAPAAPDGHAADHQEPEAIAARARPQLPPSAPAPAAPAPAAPQPAQPPQQVARPSRPAGTETPAQPTTVAPEPRPANPATAPNVAFYVQAGAFASPDEAEQQRARLALLGSQAGITRRDQTGKSVYRVRVGPFETREAASIAQRNLSSNGVDAAIVQVQK